MRVIDAESLRQNNLAYREPTLYDELLADSPLAVELVTVAREMTETRTVLDLGCGTARLLAELHDHELTGTGIDVQPDLITWALRTHPYLRLEVGDLRSVRLGDMFDLVVCVGNTLSYLHTEPELAAAFTTAAAHSHPGTLLAVATLTGTGHDAHSSSEITTSLGPVRVDTTSSWDPVSGIQVSTRAWRFADGRVENDMICRRFWQHENLKHYARCAGF